MMAMDGNRLFGTLPAALREADETAGGAASALFSIIGEQSDRLAAAIEELGESWFIETCPEWVVPYIGDLLAVRALTPTSGFSERAWVAQTIALRRRKGTLGIVGTLTKATTAWPAWPVEMFERLAATQSLKHLRLHAPATALVREPERMRRAETAFDRLPHSIDVRPIARGAGRYNVPNIGIFAWRAQVYPLDAVEAEPAGPGRFRCDPAGRELPLWNPARALDGSAQRERDMPTPLDRLSLYRDLEELRAAAAAGRPAAPVWFDSQPPLRLWARASAGAPMVEIPAAEIVAADLHDVADARGWRRPPASWTYADSSGASVSRPISVAIDPVRGRIAFPDGVAPFAVYSSHALAAPGDCGGGPYDRADNLAALLANRPVTWQMGVSRRRPPVPGSIVATVAEALAEWSAQPAGTVGIIALLDNDRFEETLTGARAVRIKRGSLLAITAADWPATPNPGGGSSLVAGVTSPVDRRGAIIGDIAVVGDAPADAIDGGTLILDGLLVGGGVTVSGSAPANLGSLVISNGTVLGPISVAGDNDRLTISLTRAVIASLSAPATVPGVAARDSIINGQLAAPGASTTLAGVTIAGTSQVRAISASDCLFLRPISSLRKQIGCLRYSYVPQGSTGPRQFRCQPELAIREAGAGADTAAIAARVSPMIDSLTPGTAGFARLSVRCDPAIATGAETGGAMGAWHWLEEPQRRANLTIALDEYLGLGLEAGLIPAS